ncbi:MAG: hypothetical protein AAFQ51_03370 [Pseudomonadota bacterium]
MATTQRTNGKSGDVTLTDLSDQIEVLKAELNALTKSTASYVQQEGQAASAQAKTKADEALRRGRETLDEARAQAGDLGQEAANFVHTRPATALGLAVGLGFVVGLLTTRR